MFLANLEAFTDNMIPDTPFHLFCHAVDTACRRHARMSITQQLPTTPSIVMALVRTVGC
jgi:hypothetical protein